MWLSPAANSHCWEETSSDGASLGDAAALAESWRLYPPTWIYVRVPLKADKLPSGVEVAAGSRLYLCPYVVHRDPSYFEHPEKYDLARFLPGSPEPLRCIYFPFGAGPRICIGAPLAKMQSALILARILQKFRVEPVRGHRIKPFAGVTLRPGNGAPLRLSRFG